MSRVLGNGPQVLGNDNGPPVLGIGPHLLGIMLHLLRHEKNDVLASVVGLGLKIFHSKF